MADHSTRGNRSWSLLFGLALLFLAAMAYLFGLRFENGDFLPAYSSLRKDPMGTAVLYESLQKSGLAVERNHAPLSQASPDPGETLFIGGYRGSLTNALAGEATRQAVTEFVEQGGRLVITSSQFFSRKRDKDEEESSTENQDCREPGQENDQTSTETIADDVEKLMDDTGEPESDKAEETVSPWAVSMKRTAEKEDSDFPSDPLAVGSFEGKRLVMAWPGNMVFEDPDPQWNIVLTHDNEPVLIERSFGKGTIVLSTSSFFLSNEAMLRDRQVTLLRWLVGGPQRLIFDEYHHGLRSQGSIIGLARNQNLHGVMILLFLLAALFLWKNSSSLLPRHSRGSGVVRLHSGRDQFEGLVNILRLHPPGNLVGVVLSQWEKGQRKWCRGHPDQIRKMRELAGSPSGQKETEEQQVARYRSICRVLNQDKKV
ncbi:MAG: DUF4350 domain-containing protein [Thermodesulfobacteriota bacterium]